MKILLVEDDEDKRDQLSTFLLTNVSDDLIITKSLQSAIRALISNTFDLIFLDMSMTTFDITPTEMGGRPQPFGGREVLLQMKRRSIFTPVVVVTQYDRFGQGDDETSLSEVGQTIEIIISKHLHRRNPL